MILVDSNVIIDVLTNNANWSAWSASALSTADDADELAINPIIYAGDRLLSQSRVDFA